jgi:DNA-binding CsgD family transcriptional regulator
MNINLNDLSILMPDVYLWKKDLNSRYIELNVACADLFGINPKKDISGLADDEIPCPISEFAEVFRSQDKQVIDTGNPIKILEVHQCANEKTRVMLNTKSPLRGINNEGIIGTFAYCMDITNYLGSFCNFLMQVQFNANEKGLITGSYPLHQSENHSFLTEREMECLFYLLRGKTNKEVAKQLHLSPRTVEQYVEQLKNKFGCDKKSELIEFAVNKGYMNIIPSNLLNLRLSKGPCI